MKYVVVVGFSDKNYITHLKGDILELDEATATTLQKKGWIKPVKSKNNTNGEVKNDK